jgi:predicted transcriptional regulator
VFRTSPNAQPVRFPGERVPISAFVDEGVKRRLVELAVANERSLSAELRLALARYVGHLDRELA